MSPRGRGHDDSKRRRRLVFGVVLGLVCLSFAHATEEFCREDLIRDAYERHTNNTEPFENQCNAGKYASMESQLRHLVELRVKQKQPLTEACMDHVSERKARALAIVTFAFSYFLHLTDRCPTLCLCVL